MSLLIIASDSPAQEGEDHSPSRDTLYEGFIDMGNPMEPSGEAYIDQSFGPSYGDGRRYECEEYKWITKTPSKHIGTKRGHS